MAVIDVPWSDAASRDDLLPPGWVVHTGATCTVDPDETWWVYAAASIRIAYNDGAAVDPDVVVVAVVAYVRRLVDYLIATEALDGMGGPDHLALCVYIETIVCDATNVYAISTSRLAVSSREARPGVAERVPGIVRDFLSVSAWVTHAINSAMGAETMLHEGCVSSYFPLVNGGSSVFPWCVTSARRWLMRNVLGASPV